MQIISYLLFHPNLNIMTRILTSSEVIQYPYSFVIIVNILLIYYFSWIIPSFLYKISFFGIDNLPYYACSYHIMEQISNRRNEHEYVNQFGNRREKNLTKHDNKHPHNFKNEVLRCFRVKKKGII